MAEPTRYDHILEAAKALVKAERKSKKACDARGALPPGSSRARVTTANANWTRAAEHRDKCQDALVTAVADAGLLADWRPCK